MVVLVICGVRTGQSLCVSTGRIIGYLFRRGTRSYSSICAIRILKLILFSTSIAIRTPHGIKSRIIRSSLVYTEATTSGIGSTTTSIISTVAIMGNSTKAPTSETIASSSGSRISEGDTGTRSAIIVVLPSGEISYGAITSVIAISDAISYGITSSSEDESLSIASARLRIL